MNVLSILILLSHLRKIWTEDSSSEEEDDIEVIVQPVEEECLRIPIEDKLDILDLLKKEGAGHDIGRLYQSEGHAAARPGVNVFKEYGLPMECGNVPLKEHFYLFKDEHILAMLRLMEFLTAAGSLKNIVRLGHDVRPYLNEHLFHAAITNCIMNMNIDTELPSISLTSPEDFVSGLPLEIIEIESKIRERRYVNRFRRHSNMTVAMMDQDQDIDEETSLLEAVQKLEILKDGKKKRQVDLKSFAHNLFNPNAWLDNIFKGPLAHLNRDDDPDQDTVNVKKMANGQYLINQILDLSGTDPDLENRVAYFREDYGMNSHHYNWHLIMTNIANIPRRNEYFVYMHSQMLRRYNIERFAVGLRRTEVYLDFETPIEAGHQANLGNSNKQYGVRNDRSRPVDFANLRSQNEKRKELENILRDGIVNDETGFMVLLEQYHNEGHMNIASTVVSGTNNVMAASQVAARDNVFYRWHQHIDGIYEQYQDMKSKITKTWLTYEELVYTDIQINQVTVESNNAINELFTGCGYHRLDISNGLNFNKGSKALVNMIHLDHMPFTYHITLDNLNRVKKMRRGLVRIFMAPVYDDTGNRMGIEQQREFWIEMDKFMYKFKQGSNVIVRRGQESSVTVDCRDSFDDIAERAFAGAAKKANGHCGCGWPQHLLVPRGTPEGMLFNLFVIITEEKNVKKKDWHLARSTYCGLPNIDLSDSRRMGFPFHDPAPGKHRDIYEFANSLPNAFVSDIRIIFTGVQTDHSEEPVDGCGR